MNNKLVLIITLVFVFSFFITSCTGEKDIDELAACLTEKGAKLYGTEWCSHCQAQKTAFGSSFDKVDFVDCDLQRAECIEAGISGYPTWKIDGKNYPGQQEMDKLASLSGC